jgi:DNA primase
VLAAAQPLAEALFDLIRDGTGDKTAEQRAQLRHRLEAAAQRITDRALSREYRSVLLDRFFADRRRPTRVATARPLPRPLPSGTATADERTRILTAVLLRHPRLLSDVAHAFATIELSPDNDRLRKALLSWSDHADVLDSQGLIDHLTASGLAADAARVLAAVPFPLPAFASAEATPGDAEEGWWHIFGLMQRGRLEQDVATAQRDFEARVDPDSQRRLIALRTDLVSVQCGEEPGEAKA